MAKKDDAYWREKLSPQEYHVCRQKGTERAFTGEFWDCETPGTYHCRCCDAPLFHSTSKYDAGCGWPSFFRAADQQAVREEIDNSLGMSRVEAQCRACGSHLGHVFTDGPAPTGQRYCINSASIRLVKASGN